MLRLTLILTALLISTTSAFAENSRTHLDLVRNGTAVCTIVVPVSADKWTNQAAQWLTEYIRKTSSADPAVVTEDRAPAGTLISVGHTALAAKAGIDTKDLKWDGCRLIAKDGTLFLLGHDQQKAPPDEVEYKGARGTCRSVLKFLEDYCGIRWLLPGLQGEYVPHKSDISVPSDLSVTFTPAFAYSDARFPYGLDTPGALANNFRVALASKAGGEIYYAAIPPEKYFKDHPEYFALINGKRTAEGNHLCSSNPEVGKLILKYVESKLDEGYDMFALGQEDGYVRCECPNCEKLDSYRFPDGGTWNNYLWNVLPDHPAERVFLLHKWVIDQLRKSHPDKMILLNCYGPTSWPSKKIKTFGDTVMLELALQEPMVIDAWKGKGRGISGYVYWFDNNLPMGMDIGATPREVSEKIRFMHDQGFIGFYQFPESNFGMQGLSFYVLGRMMGDPSLDYRKLEEEYCHGVYGKAGDTMLQFFDLVYARHEQVLPLEQRRGNQGHMPRWITTEDIYTMMYPPELLSKLEQLMEKAEGEADSDHARGWLRLTRDHFDFTRLLTRMVLQYKAYQANPTRENLLQVKQCVDDFNAWRMKVITYTKEYTDNWFPGHDVFCNYLTANGQHESKVYYVPWETRKPEVLKQGLKGMAIGYGSVFGYSYILEPLTIDFDEALKNGFVHPTDRPVKQATPGTG